MKFHVLLYLVNIAQDVKHFVKNYNSNNKSQFLIYSSDIVEKIQLSVELMYEMIYGNKNINLFEMKKYVIFVLEIIRESFRLRELKSISELGYNFYIEKNIYLQNVLGKSEEEYNNKLQLIE